jgi:hypothetical protein
VIGVYEPMIVAEVGQPRTTGRLAEPDVAAAQGLRYHTACWPRAAASAEGRRETPLYRP